VTTSPTGGKEEFCLGLLDRTQESVHERLTQQVATNLNNPAMKTTTLLDVSTAFDMLSVLVVP
jgi:hypothetical protein